MLAHAPGVHAKHRKYFDEVFRPGVMLPFLPGKASPTNHLKIWDARYQSVQVVQYDDENHAIAQARYHYLPTGFRVTPQPAGRKTKHLFLAGCSFTLGDHVEDDETPAARMASVLPEWKVVNIAKGGMSIGETYFLLSNHDLRPLEVPEEGVMIFQIGAFQQPRIVPTWSYLSWASGESVLYRLVDGELEYRGRVADQLSWRWEQLMKWSGLEYLWLRLVFYWDVHATGASDDLLLALLKETKASYLAQYPKGRFIVHSLVNRRMTHRLSDVEFLRRLKSAGIEAYATDYRDYATPIVIQGDGHPNPLGHLLQARAVLKSLEHVFGPRSVPELARGHISPTVLPTPARYP